MTTHEIVDAAKDYLAGGVAGTDSVLGWRTHLRAHQRPALARALSRRLAEGFIAGDELTADQVDAIWKACRTDEAFSHARRVLKRRVDPLADTRIIAPPADPATAPSAGQLRDQLAMMTSKDPDLAASVRHDWALRLLQADLATSSAETLGIAGGILKRRWEWDGRTSSLEQSLLHYLAPVDRGFVPGTPLPDHDRDGRGVTSREGYPAINAAFVCDLLAEQTDDPTSEAAYTARADALRRRVCDAIAATDYWSTVTLAEANLGLRRIDEAERLLRLAAALTPDPWERETAARQMARLGDLREISLADTTRVVQALVGGGERGPACVESILVGKVGLALSGGGFRASLYHLGVLARLAECDLLRHVAALSTVSGGSMVGAAYYLRVRHLLQTTEAPGRAEFVDVVERLIEDFREGTNANLRTSLLTDFRACRAILTGDDAVYAERMAAAIWSTLYSRTAQGDPVLARDPEMAELVIAPRNAPEGFHPKYHNTDRTAKVPALLVNATALNTGHSWHFTTQSMGESPFSIAGGADAQPRLRRSYYRNPQGEIVRSMTLSQAVAASACVPGLFAPLRLRELYEGYDVGLVDGGVYDNQGALALMQEDCSVLIVSDAAGQLGVDPAPGGGHVSPLLRAMDIFQERMRLASFERLRAAHEQGQLTGLAYVHLKQDLQAAAVDWKDCEDPSRDGDQLPGGVNRNARTGYGVWKAHQEHLAAIRTDLDVFSDIEAASLMSSGYLAMDVSVRRLVIDVPALAPGDIRHTWFFSPVIPKLRDANAVLDRHLKAGAIQFLRLARLDRDVRRWLSIGAALVVALVLAGIYVTWSWPIPLTVGGIVALLAAMVGPVVAARYLGRYAWAAQLVNPLGALQSQARQWIAIVATWWLARRTVPRLTRKYLEAGDLRELLGKQPPRPPTGP